MDETSELNTEPKGRLGRAGRAVPVGSSACEEKETGRTGVRGKGNGPKGSQALVLDGLPGRSAAQLLMYGPKTLYKCLQEQGCGARRTAGALRGRVEMKQPETPRLRQTIRSDPHSI